MSFYKLWALLRTSAVATREEPAEVSVSASWGLPVGHLGSEQHPQGNWSQDQFTPR